MKIKKIFIYLSLVLSSITLLPSTGRALKSSDLGDRILSSITLLPSTGRALKSSDLGDRILSSITLLPSTGRALKSSDLGDLKFGKNSNVKRANAYQGNTGASPLQRNDDAYQLLNEALWLSREDQDIDRAIKLSLKEHERQNASNAQVQTGVVSLPGRNELREERDAEAILSPFPYINNNRVNLYSKEELDFQNLLSEAEVRRITGKPTKTIGRYKIQNTEGYDVLETPLDGLCGLHCLGIDPEKAVSMINHVILTRNLREDQRILILATRRNVEKLLKDRSQWLYDSDVQNIANLVLGKHLFFHHHHRVTERNTDYIPENEIIRVHFIENFHFSKMVER